MATEVNPGGPADPARRGPGRPSDGARAAIVAAARELFVARDFDDVSTAEVVAEAGVSRGALYHHFPGKLELFEAVHEELESQLATGLRALVADQPSPLRRIEIGSHAYLLACETSEELVRIGLRQARAVLGWERWSRTAHRYGLGLVEEAFSEAMDAGEVARADPRVTALIYIAVLIEAGLTVAGADDRPAARLEAESLVDRVLAGLAG